MTTTLSFQLRRNKKGEVLMAAIVKKCPKITKLFVFTKAHRHLNAHPDIVRATADKCAKTSKFKRQHTFHVTFKDNQLNVYVNTKNNKFWFEGVELKERKNLTCQLSCKYFAFHN